MLLGTDRNLIGTQPRDKMYNYCLLWSKELRRQAGWSLESHRQVPRKHPHTSVVGHRKGESKFQGRLERAQRLRAVPALPKVLSSIPSNHLTAHSHP